jgi:hypothetical protein
MRFEYDATCSYVCKELLDPVCSSLGGGNYVIQRQRLYEQPNDTRINFILALSRQLQQNRMISRALSTYLCESGTLCLPMAKKRFDGAHGLHIVRRRRSGMHATIILRRICIRMIMRHSRACWARHRVKDTDVIHVERSNTGPYQEIPFITRTRV